MARCSLQKTLMICIVKGISLGTNTYAVSRLLPSQYSLENKIGKNDYFGEKFRKMRFIITNPYPRLK